MNMVSGEKEIARSPDGGVVLTSHRVRYERRGTGHSQILSITLDAVSSCGVIARSSPMLLLLALLAAVGGYFLQHKLQTKGLTIGGLAVAAGLVVSFLLTRSNAFRVSSAGESIAVSVAGSKGEGFAQFIDEVEKAKLVYLGKAQG